MTLESPHSTSRRSTRRSSPRGRSRDSQSNLNEGSPLQRLGTALVLSLVAAWLVAMLGQANVFSASTFVVNDPIDRLDDNPGDGVCHTWTGTCSLRAAIQEANMTIEADVIQLPAGTFEILRESGLTDDITSGDFDITAPLTITGASRSATIIDGGPAPFG